MSLTMPEPPENYTARELVVFVVAMTVFIYGVMQVVNVLWTAWGPQ